MKINISIPRDDAYNCIDNLIVAIAQQNGRNYELAFCESWSFDYSGQDASGRFGDRFGTGLNMGKIDFLWKYHGIKVDYHKTHDMERIQAETRAELDAGRPIIINMDNFWCPWYKAAYQVYHSHHSFMVVDFDEQSGILSCMDGQMAHDGAEISIDELKKGIYGYVTVRIEDKSDTDIDWRGIIENAVEKLRENDSFNKMRSFGEDLGKGLNISEEVKGYESNFIKSPFYQELFKFNKVRKLFAKVLKHLSELFNIEQLAEASELMKVAGDKWSSIFGMLVKLYYMPDSVSLLSRVASKIKTVADEEEKLADILIDICRNEKVCIEPIADRENAVVSGGELKEYRFVPLASYCNNQGFGSYVSLECKAEFSNGKKYFLTEGLPAGRLWNVEDMKFEFPELGEGIKDNISCDGQLIEGDYGEYSYIMVLGCSEYGNHFEYMNILYEDGYEDKILLQLTNWGVARSSYGEKIAWTGRSTIQSSEGIGIFNVDMHIFAKAYKLKHKGNIKSIRLPQCLNMHIFAITLGK